MHETNSMEACAPPLHFSLVASPTSHFQVSSYDPGCNIVTSWEAEIQTRYGVFVSRTLWKLSDMTLTLSTLLFQHSHRQRQFTQQSRRLSYEKCAAWLSHHEDSHHVSETSSHNSSKSLYDMVGWYRWHAIRLLGRVANVKIEWLICIRPYPTDITVKPKKQSTADQSWSFIRYTRTHLSCCSFRSRFHPWEVFFLLIVKKSCIAMWSEMMMKNGRRIRNCSFYTTIIIISTWVSNTSQLLHKQSDFPLQKNPLLRRRWKVQSKIEIGRHDDCWMIMRNSNAQHIFRRDSKLTHRHTWIAAASLNLVGEKLTGKLMKMLCCVKNKSIILFSDSDCFSSSSLRLRLNSQDSGSEAGDSTLNLVKVYDVFVSCSMFFVRLCSISPVSRIAPCFCLADNLSCLIPKVFWIC